MNCEPGYYCESGNKYMCPTGYYGNSPKLTNSSCSGLCPQVQTCLLIIRYLTHSSTFRDIIVHKVQLILIVINVAIAVCIVLSDHQSL